MKNILTVLVLTITAFVFSACEKTSTPTTSSSTAKITVKDAKYGDQEVPIDPQKIVSFDYGALDTLQALGLQSKVAGLPKSNLPEILKPFGDAKYADAGNLFEPNFELL